MAYKFLNGFAQKEKNHFNINPLIKGENYAEKNTWFYF